MYLLDEANKIILEDIEKNDPGSLSELVKAEAVFTDEIPEAFINPENAPMIRLNEMSDLPDFYASNEPLINDFTVMIALWAKEYDEAIKMRQRIDKIMLKNCWYIDKEFPNYPIHRDDDLPELYMTARAYTKKQFINNEGA